MVGDFRQKNHRIWRSISDVGAADVSSKPDFEPMTTYRPVAVTTCLSRGIPVWVRNSRSRCLQKFRSRWNTRRWDNDLGGLQGVDITRPLVTPGMSGLSQSLPLH